MSEGSDHEGTMMKHIAGVKSNELLQYVDEAKRLVSQGKNKKTRTKSELVFHSRSDSEKTFEKKDQASNLKQSCSTKRPTSEKSKLFNP